MKALGLFALLLTSITNFAQTPVLSFNGAGDMVNLGGNAGDNIRTFEMWFSPTNDITDGTATTQTLIARETEPTNTREEFDLYFWNGSGNLQFLYREDAAPNTVHSIQSNSNSWTANQWYHVAVVIHPTNGITMFIDGDLQTATDPTWTAATITIPGTMGNDFTALGTWGEFGGRFFDGRMEDVRFSTNALYSMDFTPPCPTISLDPSTTGLWNFNTGSGTTAFDSSPSGNDGAITGATWPTALICETGQDCMCNASFEFSAGPVDAAGNQAVSLFIDSGGEEVTSICIELPFYASLVDAACLACDTENQGANGTILSGTSLMGVSGMLDDPYGLGYGRKICYEFASPTVVSGSIDLSLKFPAVLDLSCCSNDVRYCLDVEIKKDDCTVCEYEVCPNGAGEGEANLRQEGANPISTTESKSPLTDLEAEMLVYPNPTTGIVNVTIKDESFENGTVELVSLDGKSVQKQQVNTARFQLDVSQINAGTYLIMVRSGNKVSSERLVVN